MSVWPFAGRACDHRELLLAASAREMDEDVGGYLDSLRQDLHDQAVYQLLLRGRQLQVRRDGRQVANVVASTHGQAPLDHELLNIGEPLRPLEFRAWPLH